MDAAKNLPIWEGRARASDLLIGATSPLFRLSQPISPSLPANFYVFPNRFSAPPNRFFAFPNRFSASPSRFFASPNCFFRLTCPAFRLSQPLLRLSQSLFPPHLLGFLLRLIRFWCRTNANFPLRGPKNHLLWGIPELQYPCFCPFMGEKQLLSDFSACFSVSRFLVFKSLYNRFLCGF